MKTILWYIILCVFAGWFATRIGNTTIDVTNFVLTEYAYWRDTAEGWRHDLK